MNTFFRHCIALAGLATICFTSFHLFGQSDKYNVDSIRAKVQRLSSDTDKVTTLLDRVNGFDCDDSLKKLILANDAKRLAENIKWRRGILKANRVLGQVYLQCQKNYSKAFEYLQLNVDFSKKNEDITNEAIALQAIAREYDILHQQTKSIEYYSKILELEPSPGIEMRANILGNMGVSFSEIGDYNHALVFYDSSLKLISSKPNRDKQDTNEIAGLHLNMGDLYLSNSNPDKAAEQYQLVIRNGFPIADKTLGTWGLLGIGKAYKMKKDYQHAIENYQKALQVCRESDNFTNKFTEEVKIKDELANTYLETWELPLALAYADSALSLAESQHYITLLSVCNAALGNVYLRQNNYPLAISYLQKALEIAKQTDNLEDKQDAYEALRKAYSLNGQWAEAYNSLQNYTSIRDTLYNIEKVNEFTKNDLNYQFKAQRELDSVKNHVEFAKKIERQRVLTYSVFTFLVLVLLLAFFVYRSYVTQKKYNELLAREKKRHLAHIEAQSNVLSDIADTQAHQIRGPISTILGLVHIFNYEDPADPMNKQVMEWITTTTEKLDTVVKEVIIKENTLRSEHDENEPR